MSLCWRAQDTAGAGCLGGSVASGPKQSLTGGEGGDSMPPMLRASFLVVIALLGTFPQPLARSAERRARVDPKAIETHMRFLQTASCSVERPAPALTFSYPAERQKRLSFNILAHVRFPSDCFPWGGNNISVALRHAHVLACI